MRTLFAGFGGNVMSSYQRPESLLFRSQADMAPDIAEGEFFLSHSSRTLNNLLFISGVFSARQIPRAAGF
jgi:hypothetical protein